MKTKILSILALLLMTVTHGAWAQETLTVFDGDADNQYIPMYGYSFNYYTKSECIIPASELTAMKGRTITAITFYAATVTGANPTFGSAKQQVFLKEVSGTTLDGFSGMTGATVVFDGTLPMPTTSTDGYTITFSQGYTYNGGNLLIGIYNAATGSWKTMRWYGIDNQSKGVSAYGANEYNLADAAFKALSFLPKTTFTYTPANVGRVIGLDGKYYKTKEAAVNAGTQACAIIAYVGSETGEAGYTGGLAIAMRDANGGTRVQWKNATGTGDNPSRYSDIANAISAKESGSSLSSGRNNSTTWPAFYHALNNTITVSDGISASKPASGTSGWFLPSIYQWNIILKALSGESNNLSTTSSDSFKPAVVNVKIADGDARFGDYNYLSSTEIDTSRPWYWWASGGRAADGLYKTDEGNVRAVFAFNTLTAAEYTVTYDANGGSGAPDAQTKDGGIDLTLSSTVPTRTGYTFAGWNTKADGSGTSYAAGGSYTTNDDIVLYAQWFAGEGTEASPYLIASTTDWNNLSTAVNGGETYSGKYFKMTANIGTVTTMIGVCTQTEEKKFLGVFDGGGHTLTVDYSYNEEWRRTCPFPYTGVSTVIRNLTVAGSITNSWRASGLVGTADGAKIQNCRVSATISGKGYTAAFAVSGGQIENCLFDGKLTGNAGFVGYRGGSGTSITNCLFKPQTDSSISQGTFYSTEGSGAATVTNSYYTSLAGGTAQGTDGSGMTAVQLVQNLGASNWKVVGDNAIPKVHPNLAGEGTEDSPYLIASTTDWNNLVSAVNAGETYSGNYFKMTANVGDVTPVSTWMTGTFSGTFDGDRNTLTVGYSSSASGCAPFGNLRAATIKNLIVDGTISTSGDRAGGIAYWVLEGNMTYITNCRVSATINSTFSGGASTGGIVGSVQDYGTDGKLTITGCAFTGSLLGSSTHTCGGFVGWNGGTLTIENSLFAPASVTMGTTYSATFTRGGTVTNSYYTQKFNEAQGLQARTIVKGNGVSTLSVTKGSGTTYNVAGITVYSNGVDYNSTFYGGSEQTVSLALTAETRTGYQFKQYAASQGTLSGQTTDAPTLTMPAANSTANDVVTISAQYDPLYNATFADGIDNNGWTISPSSATAGQTVTISYTGSRTNTSVSAVKKPFGLSTFSFATPERGESSNLTFTGASTEKPVWFRGTVETHNTTGTVVYNHSTNGSYDLLSFNGVQFYNGDWNYPGALYITGGLGTESAPFVLSTTSSPAPDMELTVTPNGEKSWTITMPTSDVEIQVLMPYTVTFGDDNSTLTEASGGAGVTLPSRSDIGSYTFAGWSETNETEETTTAPTIIATGEYHPTSDITLYPVYTRTEGGGTQNKTASKTMSEIVSDNSYTVSSGNSATCYTEFNLNSDVTISTSGSANCGSFWGTSPNIDWRLYQNQSGNVTVSVPDECELSSITFTFTVNNSGTLNDGSTILTSGTAVDVSGTSATFTVGNNGGKNNGQIRITAISVNYTTGGSSTTYYTSLPRVSLPYTVTFADGNDNDGWDIDPEQQIAGGTVTVSYEGENKVKSVTVAPKGALTGKFSVSSTKQVQFSKGNLQYVGTWQFAANQYDIFGESQSDDHRDLFGWGTKTNPNNTSTTNGDYSWAEWGENTITNGCTGWRTLTKDEWGYLFTDRANASTLRTFATVNSVTGLIVMPDGWTASGVTLTITTANYTTNVLSTSQWATLEKQGCVFLPAAGGRAGTNVVNVSSIGDYWSSDASGETNAYDLNFSNNYLLPQNTAGERHFGWSVRLVRDVE